MVHVSFVWFECLLCLVGVYLRDVLCYLNAGVLLFWFGLWLFVLVYDFYCLCYVYVVLCLGLIVGFVMPYVFVRKGL